MKHLAGLNRFASSKQLQAYATPDTRTLCLEFPRRPTRASPVHNQKPLDQQTSRRVNVGQPKRGAIPLHPLWIHVIKLWWTILSRHAKSQQVGYSTYKEFRLGILRALNLVSRLEESLCDVWQEWNTLMRTDFDALAVGGNQLRIWEAAGSEGSLSLNCFSQRVAEDVFHQVKSFDVSLHLMVLTSLLLHCTIGPTLAESSLKPSEIISQLPKNFVEMCEQIQGSATSQEAQQTRDIQVWFKVYFVNCHTIAAQLDPLLMELFPGDPRVPLLWKEFETPESEAMLALFGQLRQQPIVRRHASLTKLSQYDRVRLPVLGKACNFVSPARSRLGIHHLKAKVKRKRQVLRLAEAAVDANLSGDSYGIPEFSVQFHPHNRVLDF